MRTETREKILEYIRQHQQTRVHDLIRKFGLSAMAIHKQLKKLIHVGQIRKIGKPPQVCYKLASNKKSVILTHMDTKVLNYRIIIEPEKYEDGGVVYVAHCPTLDISDYGDSVEGVLDSIKEGIRLAVECLAKANKEVPVDSLEDQIITSAKISPPANLHLL